MEVGEGFDKYYPFVKKYWLPLILGALGLIFFVYGLISLLGNSSSSETMVLEKTGLASESATLIAVDVEGSVIKPGVYKLGSNSIIQDALIASQGLSDDADREWVSKNVNLAAKLSDGAKIYIPRAGEITGGSQEAINNSQMQGSNSQMDLININIATSETLDTLPGIGPVTADKIIQGRPYQNINELLDKKVVSSKVFDGIKDKITIY